MDGSLNHPYGRIGYMAESPWHSIEIGTIIKDLDTDHHHGLSEEEARRRLEQYGYNELKKEEKTSPFTLFINQFKNILIIILLVAIVLSALVGEVVDAAIIGVIVVFCAVLGFVQEFRAERRTGGVKEDAFSGDHSPEREEKKKRSLLKSLCQGTSYSSRQEIKSLQMLA